MAWMNFDGIWMDPDTGMTSPFDPTAAIVDSPWANFGDPWKGDRRGWTPQNLDAIFNQVAKSDTGNVGAQTLATLRQYGVDPNVMLDALWRSATESANPYWAGGSPTGISRDIWGKAGILPQVDTPQLRAQQGQEDQSIWAGQQQGGDDFGDLLKVAALAAGAYFGGSALFGGLEGLSAGAGLTEAGWGFGPGGLGLDGGVAAAAASAGSSAGANMWELDNWDLFGAGSDAVNPFGTYNAVSANDPIGALIQNLESGMSSADALAAVESSLPGTTRSALEQFLYETGTNSSNYLSKLLGGAGTAGGIASQSGLFGSLFGGGVGGFLDKAAASAPVLAAIQYARNQDPFDTSRLTSLYDSYNPSAMAFEYDQNTARGRDSLTSSLTNRGVMGSSFGNADITNFNTTRDLGRQSLINQGLGQRAGIAGQILDADVKARQMKNQLYGSSLLALGNVFGGRSSPTINFGGI